MKFKFKTIVLLFIANNCLSQLPIDVADNTMEIKGRSQQEFYFSFLEGDQIVFNFDCRKKTIELVEISEFPESIKYTDFATAKVTDKNIYVTKTGVYKFRVVNNAFKSRIVHLKIQRIPASVDSRNFNTSVQWKSVYDTTYYNEKERYLISKDTAVHNIVDQVSKVHSSTNLNGNKSTLNFSLPSNTIAWSYYIGVDQEGIKAFQDATETLAKVAGPLVQRIPGYGPLANLALHGISFVAKLQTGEDIDYYLVEGSDNVNAFLAQKQFYYLKTGKVINDFAQMTKMYNGNYHFCLKNDNAITPVSVVIKVTAVTVKENWGERTVQKMKVTKQEVPVVGS